MTSYDQPKRDSAMKIFVAGATGAIGSRAVPRLIQAGHDVTALVRSNALAIPMEATGAHAVKVSLLDEVGMRTVLGGHDTVVNLATHIPSGANAIKARAWREDDWVRTEGSAVLARAAQAAGVGCLIQEAVSFVYPDNKNDWITERTQPTPNPRSQSATMAATAHAVRFATEGGRGIVLRFGQLYGCDRNSREALARTRSGKPVVLGKPAAWLSPLHPEDAASAVVAALTCDSGIYNVCEAPVRRANWAVAIGRAARSQDGVDDDSFYPAAKFYPALLQRLAGPRAEPLTRSHRVSNAAFTEATGWRPQYNSLGGGWLNQAG
jgi:nucleoside-diphosphate-sugar epimerase